MVSFVIETLLLLLLLQSLQPHQPRLLLLILLQILILPQLFGLLEVEQFILVGCSSRLGRPRLLFSEVEFEVVEFGGDEGRRRSLVALLVAAADAAASVAVGIGRAAIVPVVAVGRIAAAAC